jgi:hypothetical protein
MEYDVQKGEIYSNKIVNELDNFVIDFIKILDKNEIKYVIVSGYVSIVLGRTRASEDVDLLIPKINFDEFCKIFNSLKDNNFECLNTYIIKEAFEEWHDYAIRFSRIGRPTPNMEFKMITNKIQEEAFEKKIKLFFGDNLLYISPLELQIAYKLSIIGKGDFEEISSDKDFEDAKHIYEYFKDKLNKERLSYYIHLLKAEEMWKWLKM